MLDFLKVYKDELALLYISKEGKEEKYTYNDLEIASNKAANLLAGMGIKKGDRIFLYLDRSPMTYFFALGILKLGAVFCPLFSSFGPSAVVDRFKDCKGRLIITESKLVDNVDNLPHLIVDKDDFDKKLLSMDSFFTPPKIDNNDIAIIHYTSGTTGKPKGAVHRFAALLGHEETSKSILGLKKGTRYWCTADPAWVTGSSYGIFGPLSLGAEILVRDPAFRAQQIMETLEKYQVSIWYTAPTLLRMLARQDKNIFKAYDLGNLDKIFSVGEVLSKDVFKWGKEVLGLSIFDTWFQTETGSIMIAQDGSFPTMAGSMGKPAADIVAEILDDNFSPSPANTKGHLAIKSPWPSMFIDYWEDNDRYKSRFVNDWYITGDLAYKDGDNYFYFVSREDDIINTAGHLLSPYEVENVLRTHPSVLEAAVVGIEDKVLGEAVKAYIVLNEGFQPSTKLQLEYRLLIRNKLSPFASPQAVDFVDNIARTESGKIIRR